MAITDLDDLSNADPVKITGPDKANAAAVDSDNNLHVEVHGNDPSGLDKTISVQGIENSNSTSTPLVANGIYRGTWYKWQDTYSKLAISILADTSGIFWIDFSDMTSPSNGDDTSINGTVVYAYDPAVNGLFREHVPVQSKWVRVRYANGATAQTVFSINSTLIPCDPGLVTVQLRTIPNKSQLAGVVKNIPNIPTADGNSYQELPVSSLGNPKQSIAEIHDDILIDPLNSAQASQTIVGTSVTQLDPTPLANRRIVSVSNDGALRIAVGHTSGMTFDSGSIRMNPGSTRTFGIDSTIPVYAICENLGGIQTTSNRSPASASGTAVNPNNVVSSDNIYSNITTTGQTITATGYTAGTTNTIAKIRLGIELNRPSGITNTATFQESKTGSADSANSVSTTANLTAVDGNLYLAAISRRNNVANIVTGVVGLGLTWTQLTTEPSDDGQRTIDLWYAIGTVTGNGVVTANFNASPIHSHISVTRYSNVNSITPILDFDVGQANNSSPTTPALTSMDKGIAYMAVAGANRTMTAGTGYTLDSSELTNDGANSDSLSVEHKSIVGSGTETPTGTLSGNAHWAAISAMINPSNAADPIINLSYTLSAVPGVTNQNITPSSNSDTTFFVDITGDRSWVYGDISNINVIAIGQTIGLVQANIDYLFIELTDTTGNVSRVSMWQGAKAVT